MKVCENPGFYSKTTEFFLCEARWVGFSEHFFSFLTTAESNIIGGRVDNEKRWCVEK